MWVRRRRERQQRERAEWLRRLRGERERIPDGDAVPWPGQRRFADFLREEATQVMPIIKEAR